MIEPISPVHRSLMRSKKKMDFAERLIRELRNIQWISEWPRDRERKNMAIFTKEAVRIIRRVCLAEKARKTK